MSLVDGYFTGSGSEYGRLDIVPGMQNAAEVRRTFGLFGQLTVKLGLSSLLGEGAFVVAEIAHTLLHELGHVFDLTRVLAVRH